MLRPVPADAATSPTTAGTSSTAPIGVLAAATGMGNANRERVARRVKSATTYAQFAGLRSYAGESRAAVCPIRRPAWDRARNAQRETVQAVVARTPTLVVRWCVVGARAPAGSADRAWAALVRESLASVDATGVAS